VANVLLNAVLSHTPGNFLAEKTLKTSLKQHARIGALFLLILGAPVSRGVPSGGPTLTKENLKLRSHTSVLKADSQEGVFVPKRSFCSDTEIL
jgi:hypothetical protein